MKNFLILFLITFSFQIKILEAQVDNKSSNVESVRGAELFPGRKSTWKGFVRYDFDFQGRACRIVCPDKPAKGNPWIWNARFPDWHTAIDSTLLSEGFYVTYINTDEFNGSPEGVKIWDEYFKYLTVTFSFENRVALEGISRGGLYVYNFAKKYPYRISCIYAEAPVCDFKSWPGGRGIGKGSPQDWQLIMKYYGFRNDSEALVFKDNPVDNLERLAAARVPVLHMIGLNDSIVPPAENTFILIDRYIKLGGPATIIPCTKGKQELNGHHFDIETPGLVADFIKSNTRAFRTKLTSEEYIKIRGGLNNSAARFEKAKSGRVAFLGGSITHNSGWRDSVCRAIQKRFPGTTFEFINAGIPSLGSLPDAFRLGQDILSKGPVDLLFVEAAVNDRTNGYSDKEQIRSMEGIVRQARLSNPKVDIIFMYFVDPDKINDYNRGITPAEILNHEKVAAYYNIPAVNLAKGVTDRINNREFTWEGDFKDLHPSPFGQQIYFQSVSSLLENCWSKGKVADNIAKEYLLPSKLDPFSYETGRLIPVTKVNSTTGWILNTNWTPDDKAQTREGYVKVPMLVCVVPGKILSYRFNGTAVGIAVASGPDAGILDYCIDGNEWKSIDLFTQWSNSLHLPWFVTLGDDLKQGNHTLKIRLNSNKNLASKGTTCRIRYFYIN
jgi:sialidase-1